MRTVIITVLAVIAVAAAGVWGLAEFGDGLTTTQVAASEPLVREPETPPLADAQPNILESAKADSAPVAASPSPSTTKPAPAKPSAAKPAAAAPPPAPELEATPAPPADAPAAAADVDTATAAPATAAPPASTLQAEDPKAALAAAAKSALARSGLPQDIDTVARGKLAPTQLAPSQSAPAAEAQPSTPAAETTAPAPEPTVSIASASPAAEAPAEAQARTAKAAPASKPSKQAKADAPAAIPAPTGVAAAATSIAAQFKSRKVTYNRPPKVLALNKAIDVSLVVNATEDANAGAEALQGFPGTVVERDVDLSDIVSAQLTGVGFDITTQTVERQKLSGKTVNRWQWRVTPTETGQRTLMLEIFGYESGSLDAEPLDAYRDDIVVEVKQLDQVINWAKSVQPVFAVLAALAGASSALFAFLRFREEKKRGKAPPAA